MSEGGDPFESRPLALSPRGVRDSDRVSERTNAKRPGCVARAQNDVFHLSGFRPALSSPHQHIERDTQVPKVARLITVIDEDVLQDEPRMTPDMPHGLLPDLGLESVVPGGNASGALVRRGVVARALDVRLG